MACALTACGAPAVKLKIASPLDPVITGAGVGIGGAWPLGEPDGVRCSVTSRVATGDPSAPSSRAVMRAALVGQPGVGRRRDYGAIGPVDKVAPIHLHRGE